MCVPYRFRPADRDSGSLAQDPALTPDLLGPKWLRAGGRRRRRVRGTPLEWWITRACRRQRMCGLVAPALDRPLRRQPIQSDLVSGLSTQDSGLRTSVLIPEEAQGATIKALRG